ncbi:MAG: 5-formyltetrahydrofolate cyclo-ligase, partial [Lachnospiraceae bacterium]|nr:5-formyltetrahydrofolate cyclo-ligase [Lachnospiraceae bacterium]
MGKKQLRSLALKRREELSAKSREEWSVKIQETVRSHPWYQKADIVLSYASFRSEVCTDEINSWVLEDQKRLFLPKTDGKKHCMEFFQTDLSDLLPGYQGIREPEEKNPFSQFTFFERENVLMLMPGAAFDSECRRLGYGSGYYDRYLAEHEREIGHR